MAESKEDLKSLLMKVKEESEDFIFLGFKLVQMVTAAAMKLKYAYSLERKL